MDTSIVYYHTEEGVKTCVVVPTARKLHIIMITGKGLVHRAKPLDDEQFMRETMPLKQGLSKFGGIARRSGSTKAARSWLAKARECIS